MQCRPTGGGNIACVTAGTDMKIAAFDTGIDNTGVGVDRHVVNGEPAGVDHFFKEDFGPLFHIDKPAVFFDRCRRTAAQHGHGTAAYNSDFFSHTI